MTGLHSKPSAHGDMRRRTMCFQRYIAAVTDGSVETTLFRRRKNGDYREQPEGDGASEKIALRIQARECGPLPGTTALASEGTEAIDQSPAWKSNLLRVAVTPSRAHIAAGE